MIYCCELLIRITARNEVVGVTAPAYKAINGMGGKGGRKLDGVWLNAYLACNWWHKSVEQRT